MVKIEERFSLRVCLLSVDQSFSGNFHFFMDVENLVCLLGSLHKLRSAQGGGVGGSEIPPKHYVTLRKQVQGVMAKKIHICH